MATRFYPLTDPALAGSISFARKGGNHLLPSNKLDGTALYWNPRLLLQQSSPSGSWTKQAESAGTVAGPTNGVEVGGMDWVSDPLAGDVTISGTITLNLWALESSMSANVAINAIIEKIDGQTLARTTIAQTARTTELGTGIAAANFTVSPTSTNMHKGDRIRLRIYGDDAGTMGSGYTFTVDTNGPTASADGDTYIEFTETFSTVTSDPSGTQLFLTNTAGPDVGANLEKEMWTSRGGGSTVATMTSSAGPLNPQQWTSGGTAIEWYSRQLNAFTLSGVVLVNLRGYCTTTVRASFYAELHVVNNDGTGATLYGVCKGASDATAASWVFPNSDSTAAVWQLQILGPDLSVTAGQRLRLRVFYDDATGAVVSGQTLNFSYNGTSPNNPGDSWLTLTESVTEYSGVTEYTDSATALVDLQASGTEYQTHEYTDAATGLVDIQASGTEIHEIPDSATVLVSLQASGTELQARQYTDADTSLVDLQASGEEIREIPDSATALVDIQVETADIAEFVDSDTALVDLQASGEEFPAKEYTDADTVGVLLTPSGTDEYTPGQQGTEYTDDATAQVYLQASSVELAEFVDAATSSMLLTPSSTEEHATYDSATSTVALSPSTVETHEIYDSATVSLTLQPSADELQAHDYLDSDTANVVLTPSTADIATFYDSETVIDVLTPSGDELKAHDYADADTASLALSPSATETADYIDSATITETLTPDGTDVVERETLDSETITVALTPSTVELAEFVDAQTIGVLLSASSVEVVEFADAATANVLLTPTSDELAEYTDTFEIYLTITPSGTDTYVPAPQFAVPDGDVTSDGWQVHPLYTKLADSDLGTYVYATAV